MGGWQSGWRRHDFRRAAAQGRRRFLSAARIPNSRSSAFGKLPGFVFDHATGRRLGERVRPGRVHLRQLRQLRLVDVRLKYEFRRRRLLRRRLMVLLMRVILLQLPLLQPPKLHLVTKPGPHDADRNKQERNPGYIAKLEHLIREDGQDDRRNTDAENRQGSLLFQRQHLRSLQQRRRLRRRGTGNRPRPAGGDIVIDLGERQSALAAEFGRVSVLRSTTWTIHFNLSNQFSE